MRQLRPLVVVGHHCTVERLMRELGIRGAMRGKKHRTTIPGDQAARPADVVDRSFKAPAPNRRGLAYFEVIADRSGP